MSALRLAAVLALMVLAGSSSAGADDHRYEVTLIGGASVLDTRGADTGRTFRDLALPFEAVLPPAFRGLFPSTLPATLEERSSMGGSALFGFVASRRVGSRAWVETSFLIAPSHSLRRQASFDCRAELCALAGLSSLSDLVLADERVVAYHYGAGFAYELTRGEVRPYLSVGLGAVTYDVSGEGETSFAFDVGAGARLGLGERVGVKLEAADRIVLDHFLGDGTEHDLQVRAGLTFRLP